MWFSLSPSHRRSEWWNMKFFLSCQLEKRLKGVEKMARVNAGRLDGKGMGMGPKGGQRFEVWSCRLTSTWYAPSSGQMNDKCETKYMISLVFSFPLLIFLLPLNFYCGYQWLLSVWIYFVVFIFKIKKLILIFI